MVLDLTGQLSNRRGLGRDMRDFSPSAARALALVNQGISTHFDTLDAVLAQTKVFQLDTVSVFERAHLLPAFTRMGAYSRSEFEGWAFDQPQVTEYWAHCATLIPIEDWGLFEFRRQEYSRRPTFINALTEQKHLVQWVLKELENNGPMLVSQFDHKDNKRKGDWWGWSDIKLVLERMYFSGDLVSAGRTNFSRRYALPSQVELPISKLSEHEQKLELIRRSVKALGIGTEDDVADYFRFYVTEARPYIKELLAEGELEQVSVAGWKKPGLVLSGQEEVAFDIGDRQVRLLSPFDPIVWRRERAKRLYDFDYLIEIYVPEAKRQYGYYTLPILYKDMIVGRVDLKHDRKPNVLNVLALWHEPWVDKKLLSEITPHLKQELELAQSWVGAEKLNPPSKGNWKLV